MFMLGRSAGTGLLHSASSCFSFSNASSNAEKDRQQLLALFLNDNPKVSEVVVKKKLKKKKKQTACSIFNLIFISTVYTYSTRTLPSCMFIYPAIFTVNEQAARGNCSDGSTLLYLWLLRPHREL